MPEEVPRANDDGRPRRRWSRTSTDLELHDPETDVEDRQIDLAHSDRSKTPIEPYLADQWFVKMDELAQIAPMDCQVHDGRDDGRVKIMPERYAKGYLDWLSEKRDWPVGRQLVVGASDTGLDETIWRSQNVEAIRRTNATSSDDSTLRLRTLIGREFMLRSWHEWDPHGTHSSEVGLVSMRP